VSSFWSSLMFALIAAILLLSGLFIVVIVVASLVAGVDGVSVALRHHFGSHGKLAGTHYGNIAMNH